MALQDPLAAYNAANPLEATLLCQALEEAGIESHVNDDDALSSDWMGGLAPEVNKTQIWIERADAERARVVLEDFERRAAERNQVELTDADSALPPIDVICDGCGAQLQFAAHLKGSVQSCEKCGTYLDVGEVPEDPNEWAADSE